ncbi:AAA family ATPase [Myxococcota bacterium]|nr:AAA family ATPase [Myxococcota bacterium]
MAPRKRPASPASPASEDPGSSLPAWAGELRARYVSGEACLFVLHGNVRDLQPHGSDFVSLEGFLGRLLGRSKEVVVHYDYSRGARFPDTRMRQAFGLAVNARRLLKGLPEIDPEILPREPHRLLPLLEEFLTDRSQRGALVVDYAEALCPDGDLSFAGSEDRSSLVTLQRWAADPGIQESDNLVILVTENLADLNRKVRGSARVVPIEVPLPDEGERLAFVRHLTRRGRAGAFPSPGIGAERLAQATSGLSRLQIDGIFRAAQAGGGKVDFPAISEAKREIIERECYGLVEFVRSGHDFSKVGGMEAHKQILMRVVGAMREGRKERVPMGILVVGPMGTGKSFLAEAFANECGMTALKLKNFRDKWVGSTEGNLEKILSIIRAMGYVLVMIDEGDRSIGGGASGETDGGTSSRVIARLKEFMADTSHRGSIVFVMLTNRPDKLDADMKRPGRFDLKLPVFFPETSAERKAILAALIRKNRIRHSFGDLSGPAERLGGMSGAEIEAMLLRSADFAEEQGRPEITGADLEAALADYIPSRDTHTIEYMELLAVFECSSRRLLPERYRDANTAALNARLREMRLHLV